MLRSLPIWQAILGRVTCGAFSPDGRQLVSACNVTTIKLWDPLTGEERTTLRGRARVVYTLAFSPVGLVMASGDSGNVVHVWQAAVSDD
jgi:WD40 repeat protein